MVEWVALSDEGRDKPPRAVRSVGAGQGPALIGGWVLVALYDKDGIKLRKR